MKLIKLFVVFLAFLSITSCFEDRDDVLNNASTLDIQNFIWHGLNFFYLYKSDTPELANNAFENQTDLDNFLKDFNSPESLFSYLQAPQDRFSVLFEDYTILEDLLAGTSLSNGMEYGLVRYPNNPTQVFGYVRYVLPGTDAETKGVTRGLIFNRIDNQQLTETNFNALLAPESYTIGLADFDGNNITTREETIPLNKQQLTENPIFIARTIEEDNVKIGYLMYNAFTSDFDSQLNNVFGQFKADGISDLVLDLRYNGGGSVRTATYLASLITGQFTNQVYYTEQWNDDRQAQYASNGVFLNEFTDGSQTLQSLQLNRVYVITSSRTASASELVINGLKPYIDVIQIGENTTGKFQASFLLYDAPAPNFRKSEANPGHKYVMLPLVFKTANAQGVTDFVDGLEPNILQPEDYSELGILGDPSEPLLATALAEILPNKNKPKTNVSGLKTISESKAVQALHQRMWIRNLSNH